MKFDRLLSTDKFSGPNVRQGITWKRVDSRVTKADGTLIFEMKGVEVPEAWSQTATDILAQKYLRKAGVPSATHTKFSSNPKREAEFRPNNMPQWLWPWTPIEDATFGPETSAHQVFHRMAGHWTYTGWKHGYFSSEQDAQVFYDEAYMSLALQIAVPNSPQWFNTGIWWAYGIEGSDNGQWVINSEGKAERCLTSYRYPQVHACYIQPVNDDLVNEGGIMDLYTKEVRLFKLGSGTGTNFSNIRAKGEPLSNGGVSSGLMSFLKIGDVAAGAIKSGGTTRRAAKMVIVDADHPEIEAFVDLKMREERKARAMALGSKLLAETDSGEVYDDGFEGEAINSVDGQNANYSVRVTDAFMEAVDQDQMWNTTRRVDGEVYATMPAKTLWNRICRAAHACADPGLQFHDTINRWHTCKADGEIRASNPCCFIGETLVDTSEGFISIAQLQSMNNTGKELPFAFSFDREAALPALRRIKKAWIAGKTKRLIKVTLDNGQELTCTPEHKFLTRKNGYIEAQELWEGASLRKIGRTINTQRASRTSILHRCTQDFPNGTVYQNRWMWEQVYGPIPDGYEVHHLNDDPTDDRLSNFDLRESLEHKSLHSSGEYNGRYIPTDDRVLVEIYDAIDREPAKTYKYKTGPNVTPGRWNAYIRANGLNGKIPQAQSPTNGGRIKGMYWSEFVNYMDELRASINTKVISVEPIELEEAVNVYDIEVEGTHNFGVRQTNDRNMSSIVVSNSEYMHLDNTACNLASINLVKAIMRPSDPHGAERLKHVARLWTVILDISISMASFPSKEIAEGSHNYRTLGLGYANLGALLMQMGKAYDSEVGRAIAADLTALIHGVSYCTSAELASELGAFPRYEFNKTVMAQVLQRHHQSYSQPQPEIERILANMVINATAFRNAQVTLIAPTGTISFVMDCDTTGIEPDFALVKYKKLAGGGDVQIVNESVGAGLQALGYTTPQIEAIKTHILTTGTVEGSDLKPEHLPIFDCAVPSGRGTRFIRPEAHLLMMAAVQHFLSGAISKTVNMPSASTVEDVSNIYHKAWELGLKSVAIYRDQSKMTQPLSTTKTTSDFTTINEVRKNIGMQPISNLNELIDQTVAEERRGKRYKLPSRIRGGYRQKFVVDGHTVYLHTGPYPDGALGEIFIEMADHGSIIRSLMGAFSKAVSLGLQYGTPLSEFVDAFVFTKFEPAGIVEGHEYIRLCSSVLDVIFRDLGIEYLQRMDLSNIKIMDKIIAEAEAEVEQHQPEQQPQGRASIAGACPQCGHLLQRTGTCVSCSNCPYNTGCG